MSILRISPLIPTKPTSQNLSSIGVLTDEFSQLSIKPIIPIRRSNTFIIRMGGGPRTFPGGVSKWQWKRMQLKKQKQLLKARLSRERQIYEMRKRAELRAAVSELERPWEVVERAPTLFSVSADEQLKALADRFHKPGGYDLWSERDGPQLFHTADGLPSARFLPKDAVHSVKPYGVRRDSESEDELYDGNKRRSRKNGGSNRRGSRNGSQNRMGGLDILQISSGREERTGSGEQGARGGLRNKGTRWNENTGDSPGLGSDKFFYDADKNRRIPQANAPIGRSGVKVNRNNSSRGRRRPKVSQAREVYDMSLKQDGSYELQGNMLLSAGLEDESNFT